MLSATGKPIPHFAFTAPSPIAIDLAKDLQAIELETKGHSPRHTAPAGKPTGGFSCAQVQLIFINCERYGSPIQSSQGNGLTIVKLQGARLSTLSAVLPMNLSMPC